MKKHYDYYEILENEIYDLDMILLKEAFNNYLLKDDERRMLNKNLKLFLFTFLTFILFIFVINL